MPLGWGGCQKVEILGPCEIVYSPHAPKNSGARVWVEPKPGVRVAVKKFDSPVEFNQQSQPETT